MTPTMTAIPPRRKGKAFPVESAHLGIPSNPAVLFLVSVISYIM